MTKNAEQLQALVAEFSADLAATVEAFTGQHFECSRKIVENGSISIRLKQIEDRVGIIPLSWNGHVILGLRPTFKCTWDSTHSFLAVENSSFAVHAQAKSNDEPLFRVEYDRSKSNRPSSHFHVHAHRDEVTHLLGLTKKLDSTKDQKVKKFTSEFPRLSKIHFPTGGHRFRPSLEDVLESLRQEFNLDTDLGRWKTHLNKSRLKWRKIQTAAVIRDCPQTAYEILVNEFQMPVPENWECPSDNDAKIVRD